MPDVKSEAPAGESAVAVRRVKWMAILVIAAGIFFILQRVPIGPALAELETWIAEMGAWGPVVFGLIYVAAVVAVFPASLLTLVAGAVFGLVLGTITVSLASTSGAALAFLIARYLARDRIARQLKHFPKLEAVDHAVTEGGWRIVALLRLSPVVPFNLQNYLYGLTGIGFWACVVTSWVAMLPGTLLYVYLGVLGRESVEAAAGRSTRTGAEWGLLIAGLAATVAVTVYVTWLARRTLKRRAVVPRKSEIRAADQHSPTALP